MIDLEEALNEIIYPTEFVNNDLTCIENNPETVQKYFKDTNELANNPSYIRFEIMIIKYRKFFENFYDLLFMRPSKVSYLLNRFKEKKDLATV